MKCGTCSFELWVPLAQLTVSDLALYDDNRFRGRCVLSLREHYEYMEDVPAPLLNAFMDDARRAVRAIQEVTFTDRVNFAILGNTESHVHAHLIPRYPKEEELPGKSPWNDPRPLEKLDAEMKRLLILNLRARLNT